ncbi:MAG: protein kinase [Chthoniobacter sp.]|uniref:protein kinase domain-containing protein n=1 Tax=Chthoniobacter sp. TaxID=2510640 RepID=UPI0032A2C252
MAESDDPDFLPTRPWDQRGESPTIPATPPPSGSTPPPTPRRGAWQPPTPEQLQPGFPQYEIRAIIGSGGMGAVYKGWQKSLRRFVAIKILPAQLEDADVKFAERFQREAQAMARFTHPGIVSVYDAGETPEGLLYFVMEYVEGTDVQKLVSSHGRLPPENALAIATHVCEALAYAHRRGVIHRDIKPSNIMVDGEGQVKVADFGLAKLASDDSAAFLTGTHVRMGTPDFMAPESAWGSGTVDHRADLYAVGVMLYQMLTGQLPRGRFDPPSRRVAGLDVRFDAIVDHALQTDPERRYSSAIDIRSDLERIRTDPIPAMPTPPAPAAPPAAPSVAMPTQPLSEPTVGTGAIPVLARSAPHKTRVAPWVIGVIGAGAFAVMGVLFLNRPGSSVGPSPQPVSVTPAASTPPTLPPAVNSGPIQPAPNSETETPLARATTESPFMNTLGMKFVPVTITGGPTAGQPVLFSIWETRVQDYKAFVTETKRSWPVQSFVQDLSHPAVNVSWEDARAFCAWLTDREHNAGKLAATQSYRLPSDHEWSCAVGIGDRETAGGAPADKDKQFPDVFPWGSTWPPPPGAGNYSGEEAAQHKGWEGQKVLTGYRDGFAATAPCGSFPANPLGLFDLGGNAWEWCEDAFKPGDPQKTVRGASYSLATRSVLLSSARFHLIPTMHDDSTGFRCVLAADSLPIKAAEPSSPPAPRSASEILISSDYEWSKPENLGPGVNSAKDEYAMGISDDGLVLVLSSTREGGEHLFECRRERLDEPFGKAELIDELKPGLESGPFLSGDGLTLLYALQPNALATSDIYEAHRASRADGWERSGRLFGPASYNAGPCLSADGLTLWFNSNRSGGRGGFDLWRARRPSPGAPFEAPVNLGSGVNTDAEEFSPRITADNRALLFYRERHGTGQRLFVALADDKGSFNAQPLVLAVNSRVQAPTLSTDGLTLYFASDMPGGQGGWDLWQIRRVPRAR